MIGRRGLFVAPRSEAAFAPSEGNIADSGLVFPTSSQRLILGTGFAVLLAVSAASIALDVKSRSDAAWISHTQEVTNKITDLRLLFRLAESAARGYLLTGDQYFAEDYRLSLDRSHPR